MDEAGERRQNIGFKEHLINNQIRATELRVLADDGAQLGVMGLSQAMKLADEAELDLVLISPSAIPPVARIIDYGKYKFETLRKEKEQKKANKQTKLKEIQLSLNIQENEIAFKMKSARGFIDDGNKVKVAINRIRGRQAQNADKGLVTMQKFADDMSDIADIEQPPTKGGTPGRNLSITMVLGPKKGKK